jgi:hypothetical protein
VLADALELVELGVVAGGDYAAIAQDGRRRFDNGARQQIVQIGIRADLLGEFDEQRRIFVGEDLL